LADFSAKLNKKMKNIYSVVLCCFFYPAVKKIKEVTIDEIPWK
jgi:hypothetical protein